MSCSSRAELRSAGKEVQSRGGAEGPGVLTTFRAYSTPGTKRGGLAARPPPPCWVPAGFPGGTYHGGNYIINGVMSCVTCASLTRMQPDEDRGFFICLVLSPNRGDCPDWVPIKHCLDRRADGMGEGLGSGLSALAILTTALKDAAQREA